MTAIATAGISLAAQRTVRSSAVDSGYTTIG